MKIKTIGIKYPQTRLVMNKVPGVDYTWIQNYINPLLKRYGCFEVWKPLFDFGVTGYHTVNTVMLTDKPWCVSFEDYVPRGSMEEFWETAYWGHDVKKPCKRIDRMVEAIAKDNCKCLMALSECNLKMQQDFYRNYCSPEVVEKLIAKTILLKVPQATLVDAPHVHKKGEKIKFCFVGNDFFRKGGLEMISAMRELRKKRTDFEFYLVTKLESTGNYALYNCKDTPDEENSIREYVLRESSWIHYQTNVPNQKVLELIKSCDVGLLPTWNDTYGYSVLEMQACGVPVITTNVRALPETNTNGWFVELDTNHNGEVLIFDNWNLKKKTRESMISQLYSIIDDICEHPDQIYNKAQASLEYIKTKHSPESYAESLKSIYSTFK